MRMYIFLKFLNFVKNVSVIFIEIIGFVFILIGNVLIDIDIDVYIYFYDKMVLFLGFGFQLSIRIVSLVIREDYLKLVVGTTNRSALLF